MKAYQIDSFGTENLEKADLERPEPGPDQLLLEMKAASLNYRDYMMVEGTYNPNQSLPLIPLSDGVGEVIQAGSDVDALETGDRVCPLFFQDWQSGQPTVPKLKTALGGPLDGTLREYMVVDERGVASVPDYLSNEAAATLPCAALTAWHALFEEVPLKSGQTVLCLGTGGVSLFALQLAKAAGANVIITSSSDRKLERAAEFGADYTINYKKAEDWGARAKELSPGSKGVDHVVEVGGANTLQKSVKATKPGGHISIIGVLSGIRSKLNITPVLMQNIRLQGIIVGHGEMFGRLTDALGTQQLTPVIDKVFKFDQTPEAFEYLSAGNHMGKVVINFT